MEFINSLNEYFYFMRFFGCIRQAGGSSDHPSTPTFLQIYKLWSTYSIIKPPKYGNCSIVKDDIKIPLIKLSSLQIKEKNGNISKLIKEKIDHAISTSSWNGHVILDHDYTGPEKFDSIIYYSTAQICQKLSKFMDCSICTSALTCSESINSPNKINFLQSSTEEKPLIHPNYNLYCFIKKLESITEKNKHSIYFFEDVLTEALNTNMFSFACEKHKSEVICQIFKFYLQTRMHNISNEINNTEKINQYKKKSSKFCIT